MFRRFAAIYLLFSIPIFAAFDYQAHSTRSAALHNSYLASSLAADAFLINPALTINAEKMYAGLSAYRPFGLGEFSYGSGMLAFSGQRAALGLAMQSFGSGTIYNEGKGTLNAAIEFPASGLAVGLSVNGYWISASGYDNLTAAGLDLGLVYQLSAVLRFAVVLNNLNQPKMAERREEIPQQIQFGIEYRGAEGVRLHAVLRKDSYYPLELAFGVEYQILTRLNIQSGFNSIGSMPSLGVQLQANGLEFGYSLEHHFELGSTHVIGIGFRG